MRSVLSVRGLQPSHVWAEVAVAATEASPAAAAAARLQQSPPSHPTPLPHLKRKAYVLVCVSVPV